MEKFQTLLRELQQKLGFVERERIASGQPLLGEIRDRVFEMTRALAEPEQFLAHALVDRIGIGEARTQRFEIALALIGVVREIGEARVELAAHRAFGIAFTALERDDAPGGETRGSERDQRDDERERSTAPRRRR